MDRTMAVSPRLPRSIQESGGSSSSSPSVRWPFANLFDDGPRAQIFALKGCERDRQDLEYEVHALEARINRFDERLERLQAEANLSDDKLKKCVAVKEKMEQVKAVLDNKEKDLLRGYNKLRTEESLQNSQIASLAAQMETLKTESESMITNLRKAYQKFKVLHEENEILQKLAEDRACLLPLKKRSTSSAYE